MSTNILEVKSLYKKYTGTIALNYINCSFEKGKIHALLGKNGCGKSTFANIIAGVVVPTSGTIFLNDKEVQIASPHIAREKGIGLVHQELSLISSLTVAENIFLGRLPQKSNIIKNIDWKQTIINAEEILNRIGIDINPKLLVRELSIGQQQQIEIAKAITENPKLLILDEPTSALALQEVDKLFTIMRKLKDNGVTMIYISHRLQELSQIADTINVLRDGDFVGTEKIENTDSNKILQMMFGKVEFLKRDIKEEKNNNNEVILRVENLSRTPFFNNINFTLQKGEILGIAGLMGSGRTEILRGIFGLDHLDRGDIFIYGKKIHKPNPYKLKNLGVSFVSEDRKVEGLVLILSSHDNLIMASMKSFAINHFFLNRKIEKPYVDEQIKNLNVKLSDSMASVSALSGGNQQKIVLGNWLNTIPKIMLLDEPSRGIDVEAKQQIFQLIWNQKKKGVSTIMISSELEELHLVCDRIIILNNGRILKDILPSQITINDLYKSCMTKAKEEQLQ